MKLDWLATYIAFAETLSFTAASRRLHLSQPAVHLQVKRLGEHLDATLYTKHGRSLRLTARGREVLRFARETLDRVARFEASEPLPVTLAAGAGAWLHLLGPAVRAYDGPLRALTTNAEDTLLAVREGRAHLGVASWETPPADLHVHEIAVVPLVVVMPAEDALDSPTLADLDVPLIVPPVGRPHRALLARMLQGVDWTVAVECHGWDLMLHFASLGLGWTVVNGFVPLPDGLVARPLHELPPVRYQLVHADLPADALPLRDAIVGASSTRC